ncbi:hypothetical protein LH452_10495 [Laribacter hongkongensis]|uniref:hypothetical protein n=1 Tax=Laribacter hongkongensis TaxID=168471 RepID=UPI001EFE6835|nr:hypothetical protein [Laribacter hongkongensis]MCG9059360.1 hypothetical protein [Laribacter hongkongensis]MCG9086487.1 hypothetical protein [Laribacter hongkongensis]
MTPHRLAFLFLLGSLSLSARAETSATIPPTVSTLTPEQQTAVRELSRQEIDTATPRLTEQVGKQVEKQIEGEKQAMAIAKDALEVGRKSVDWWLSNIGVLMGILGVLLAAASVGIPYLMGKKQKTEWQEKLNELTRKLAEAETARKQIEDHATETERLLQQARDKTSLIPNAETLTGQLSTELLEKLKADKPPQVVRLIEQAWEAHRQKDWATAKPLWELLSLIESQDANVWFNLAYAESELGQDYQQITDYYRRAHLLDPDASTCNNWGNALTDWANTLTDEVQQQRFAEADLRYAEATELQPDDAEVYYNWGNALADRAKTLTGEAQQQRFADADQRYAKATELWPDHADTYYNWGSTLADWAKTLTGKAQQQRFTEADQRYAKATELRPDHASTYNNWGIALSDWAKTLTDEAQQQRLAEADLRYAKAIELRSDHVGTYHNWGITLSDWADTLTGKELHKCQARIKEVWLKVESNLDAASLDDLSSLRQLAQTTATEPA